LGEKRKRGGSRESAGEPQRGQAARRAGEAAGGRISCLIGILLGSGGVASTFLGADPNVSAGAAGIGRGVLGYLLGARRLATVTVVLSVAVLFCGLTASQGLIPGIEPSGHEYPSTK
jgi:hypothetical protein